MIDTAGWGVDARLTSRHRLPSFAADLRELVVERNLTSSRLHVDRYTACSWRFISTAQLLSGMAPPRLEYQTDQIGQRGTRCLFHGNASVACRNGAASHAHRCWALLMLDQLLLRLLLTALLVPLRLLLQLILLPLRQNEGLVHGRWTLAAALRASRALLGNFNRLRRGRADRFRINAFERYSFDRWGTFFLATIWIKDEFLKAKKYFILRTQKIFANVSGLAFSNV